MPCPKEEHQFISRWYPNDFPFPDSWRITDGYFGYLPKDAHAIFLGTFPVPYYEGANFFYHSQRNMFWELITAVSGVSFNSIDEKLNWFEDKKIGITDIVRVAQRKDQSCRSASDANLNVCQFNDICRLLSDFPNIKDIYLTSGSPSNLNFSGNSAGGFLGQALRHCSGQRTVRRYNKSFSTSSFYFNDREIRLFYLYTPSNNNQQLRLHLQNVSEVITSGVKNIFGFNDVANNFKALQWSWCLKHANNVVMNSILTHPNYDKYTSTFPQYNKNQQ